MVSVKLGLKAAALAVVTYHSCTPTAAYRVTSCDLPCCRELRHLDPGNFWGYLGRLWLASFKHPRFLWPDLFGGPSWRIPPRLIDGRYAVLFRNGNLPAVSRSPFARNHLILSRARGNGASFSDLPRCQSAHLAEADGWFRPPFIQALAAVEFLSIAPRRASSSAPVPARVRSGDRAGPSRRDFST